MVPFCAHVASFHIHSSLFVYFFGLCVSFILAIPLGKCWEQHSCTSFTFSIGILNGMFFFRSPVVDSDLTGECY